MPNNYYNRVQPDFIPFTKARSGEMDNELNAIVAGFDLLPADSASLTTGTATFGVDSGTANAKAIAMPDTRLAQSDGDEVIFINAVTNTGAVTVNIDGLGATSLARSDGSALSAGDLVAGLIYSMRYDATNTRYQMMMITDSYLADAQASAAASAASAAAASTSEGNAATSEVNAAASAAAALISQTAAEDWAIRAEDDPVPPASGGDGATTFSALHWAAKAAGSSGLPLASVNQTLYYDGGAWAATDAVSVDPAAGVDLDYNGTLAASTTATGFLVQDPVGDIPILQLANDAGGAVGQLLYAGAGTGVRVRGSVNGETALMQAPDAGGTLRTLLGGDPDSSASLYFAGVEKVATNVGGVYVLGSSSAALGGSQTANITIQTSTGIDLGFLGFTNDDAMVLRNQNHGGAVIISAEDSSGLVREILNGDPDNITVLRADTDLRFQVGGGTDFAINAANNGAVTLYYNAAIALQTNTSGVDVRHPTSTTPDIGLRDSVNALLGQVGVTGTTLRMRNRINGAQVSLTANDTGGIERTLLNADPDGAASLYYVGNAVLDTQSGGIIVRPQGGSSNGEIQLDDTTAGSMSIFKVNNGDALFRNNEVSGLVRLQANNSVSSLVSILIGDPDGAVQLYFNGEETFATQTNGIEVIGRAVAGQSEIELQDATVQLGALLYSSGTFYMQSVVNSDLLNIRGRNAAGSNSNVFTGDPDGAASLYHNNTLMANTETAANGGFEVNNTVTGAGLERALTVSDLSAEVKRKDTDTSRTSTVTLADDPDLAGWSLEANQMYEINAVLVVNCQAGGTTPGFQLAWQYSGSFGTGSQMGYLNKDSAGAVIQQDGTTGGISFDMAVSDSHVWIRGYFRVSTAGTLDFQWAQSTSSANFTRLEAGSFITVRNMRLGSTGTSAVHS